MIWGAGLMVKFVLLVLLVFSVASWAIILYKLKFLGRVEKETAKFAELFWESGNFGTIASSTKNYPATPLARLFEAAYGELASAKRVEGASAGEGLKVYPAEVDRFTRILKKTSNVEKARMEYAVNFLATAGNTAPFIGLFGTVWGIMGSFRSIGLKGAANLAVVAPGISEALVATAIGLFVAIPSVIAYNHVLSRIDRLSTEMDNFSSDLLNIIEKQLTRRPTGQAGQAGHAGATTARQAQS
jgi:biopolymer transport protein TolQ